MGGVSDTELDSVDQRLVSRLEGASRLGSGALVALGVTVLLGWWLHVPALIRLSPGFAAMKPNTAFCFICLGGAIYSLRNRNPALRRVLRFAPWVVLSVAGSTLLEYALGLNLRFDTWLVGEASSALLPTRMTPGAAIHFGLIALALLLFDTRIERYRQRPSEWLVFIVGMSSCAVLLGYFYGVSSVYSVRLFASMALHTAVGFVLCAGCILCARPERGVLRLIFSRTAGGVLARRLLPPVFLVPTFLGWFRVKGQHAELFGTAFGTAIFAASCMACLSFLI
ncbi:MAG: hypothetical protein ABW061_07770, partial [Polyangiaceae bacterium]